MAAPVYITTLCRYEHFRRCIESLATCSMADQTDVYIALDYPLTEKHREGWTKIGLFLDNFRQHSPFKKLSIIKRVSNYGPFLNEIKTLEEYIIPNYDCWIFSEDDNEFSPNFLEYINCCLTHFHDDKRVLAVCGYNWPQYNIKSDRNNWYRQNVYYSAWGVGIWRDRWIESHRKLRSDGYFRKHLHNPLSLWKIWRTGSHNVQLFLNFSLLKNYKYYIYDEVYAAYMHLEDQYVVMPTSSKVRNHGFDGSGIHCANKSSSINTLIDLDEHFSLLGDDTHFHHNRRAIVNGNIGFRKVPSWLFKRFSGRWSSPYLEEWENPFLIKVGSEYL